MSRSSTDRLEIGKVAGTHGVRGELRVEPWCDSPAFLAGFQTVYLRNESGRQIPRSGSADPDIGSGGTPVTSARVHKSFVLMKLEGIDTVEAAQALRGSVLHIDRVDAELPEGRYFIKDLIGLGVFDGEERVGTLVDVLATPAHDVYVVRGEDGEHMIPAVPEFVKEIDLEDEVIRVELIEGM